MPTTLLRLLLLALLVLPLAACGQAQPAAAPAAVPAPPAPAQPTTVPAQATVTPEEVAVTVVQALVAKDTVTLLPLVASEMPMRDIEIVDQLRLWQSAQVRNGICGGPVTSVEAVETTQRGASRVVRVLTRCTADGSSSLGRGGMDLTLVPAEGGYQVLDWEMVDGIELSKQYADY